MFTPILKSKSLRSIFSCVACSIIVFGIVFGTVFGLPCAQADTIDIGGGSERFKGGGDQTPPRCQFDVPRAATEPFFVKWNCTDDVSAPDEITSELWFMKNGATVPSKIGTFLGFPASVFFNEENLEAEDVESGLPAAFRLVARDRAGVATISPFMIVRAQDNSVDECTLSIVRDATESTGSTTGMPETTVLVTNASVSSQQTTSSALRVFTMSAVDANPCEIPSICDSSGNEVSFDLNVVVASDSSSDEANGTITVSPGGVISTLSGTANVSDRVLTSLSLSGSSTIDGVDASVELSCSQN